MTNDTTPTPWKPIIEGQNPRLDGIRGMAIWLVLCGHLLLHWQGQSTALDAFLSVMKLGWCGVDLFFVLSGYLITGILLKNKNSSETTAGYFLKFEARRFFRIFPLYYAVLFVLLVLIPLSGKFGSMNNLWIEGQPQEPVWYWLYLSNFRAAHLEGFSHQVLAVTWSLAIEEQFYILWPAIVFFLSRSLLLRVAAGAIITANLFRVIMLAQGYHWMTIYTFPLSRMDGLAMGALIALMIRGERGQAILRRWSGMVMALSGGLIALLMIWLFSNGYRGEYYDQPPFIRLGFPALVFFFGAMLVKTVLQEPGRLLPRIFESRFLRHLGKYSYAIYLLHLVGRIAVEEFWRRELPGLMLPETPGRFLLLLGIFFATCFALTMAMCYVSWWAWESRFLALKRHFKYRES